MLLYLLYFILFSVCNIYLLLNNNVKTRKLTPFQIKYYK